MDCAVHPGATAVDTCIKCQRAICAGCRQIIAGHAMCGFCVNAAQQQLQTPSTVPAFGGPPAGPAPSVGGSDRSVDTGWTAGPVVETAPSLGKRVLRAFGWGPLYGQIWTVWTLIWGIVWGGLKNGPVIFGVFILGYAVVAALGGWLAAMTIAFINPDDEEKVGGIVGIVIGLALCGLELLASGSAAQLVNVFFYFVTGRIIGTGIAARVLA